jgi:integrase
MSQQNWGRGNVYKRGKRWWIRFPDGTGKQRFESVGTDEAKARRQLERRLVEVEDERLPAKSKERRRTVGNLLDALMADWIARKKRSVAQLPATLKALRDALGDRRASSITKAELTEHVINRRAAGRAVIAKELKLLKQAYKLQKAIPVPDFPQSPKGNVRDVLIQPGEQHALVAAFTDPVHRDIAEFYFASGWRGIEIRSLKWEHVRGDMIHLVEEHSKTGATRDFPLHGAAAEIIARREAARLPFCAFVFHRNGRPISYRAFIKAWKRAAFRAGLGAVNPHDSRRAFITSAVDSGIDPQVVRTLSGHRSNVVFERYRIVSNDVLRGAVERRERYVTERAEERKVIPLAEWRTASK